MTDADKKPDDIWKDFRAEHQQPPEGNIFTRILTFLFFAVGGAVVGGVIGFFTYPGPRYRRLHYMMTDTPEKIKIRVIIGAAVGAIIAIVFVIKTRRSLKE